MALDKLESIVTVDIAEGVEVPEEMMDAIISKIRYLNWNWKVVTGSNDPGEQFVLPESPTGDTFFVDVYRNDSDYFTVTGVSSVPITN
jgi:hypothetical protein